MLPWEREQGTPPPRKRKGTLSSVVVRPSESAGGPGGDGDERKADIWKLEEASPPPLESRSQHTSEGSEHGVHAGSSLPQQTQYNPDVDRSGGPQYGRQSPHQHRPENHHYGTGFDRPVGNHHYRGFQQHQRPPKQRRDDPKFDRPGGPRRLGTPLRRRLNHYQYDLDSDQLPEYDCHSQLLRRPDHHRYNFDFDQPGGLEHGHKFKGGKSDARFQDTSPLYGHGRGGRQFSDVSPDYGHGWGGGRSCSASPPYEQGRGVQRFRDCSPTYWHKRDDRLLARGFIEHELEDMPLVEGVCRNDPNLAPRVGNWICKNSSCGYLNFAWREYCNNCNKCRYGSVDGGPYGSPRLKYSDPLSPHGPPPQFSGPPRERDHQRDTIGYQSPPHGWSRERPRSTTPLRQGGKFPNPQFRRGRADYHEEVEYRVRGRIDRLGRHKWDHMVRNDDFINKRGEYDRSPLRARPSLKDCHRKSPLRARRLQDFHRSSYTGRQGDRWGIVRGRNADVYQ